MNRNRIAALALGAMLLGFGPAVAETAQDHAGHSHAHIDPEVYKGYFKDEQVQDRPLSDWEGDWQSVFPLLENGTLDPVMAHKAEQGDKTAAEYRDYYVTGYRTDVDQIEIVGEEVSFLRGRDAVRGEYAADGHEILTYEKGNRGVRFIFRKVKGDEAAPDYIQFSDHGIAPGKAWHYHIYWGDDRAALLQEVTNWPTYYPKSMSGSQIAKEMIAH